MQKLNHYQTAYNLGGDVAEAQHNGDPLPFPRFPSAEELWTRIMGDAARADHPTNTLSHLRAEFEAGYADWA